MEDEIDLGTVTSTEELEAKKDDIWAPVAHQVFAKARRNVQWAARLQRLQKLVRDGKNDKVPAVGLRRYAQLLLALRMVRDRFIDMHNNVKSSVSAAFHYLHAMAVVWNTPTLF